MTELMGQSGEKFDIERQRYAEWTALLNEMGLDLMLCGMCREYDIPFVDIAGAVRDETGQLREDYCLDLSSRGCHLNDAGCAAVVDYIRENYPV